MPTKRNPFHLTFGIVNGIWQKFLLWCFHNIRRVLFRKKKWKVCVWFLVLSVHDATFLLPRYVVQNRPEARATTIDRGTKLLSKCILFVFGWKENKKINRKWQESWTKKTLFCRLRLRTMLVHERLARSWQYNLWVAVAVHSTTLAFSMIFDDLIGLDRCCVPWDEIYTLVDVFVLTFVQALNILDISLLLCTRHFPCKFNTGIWKWKIWWNEWAGRVHDFFLRWTVALNVDQNWSVTIYSSVWNWTMNAVVSISVDAKITITATPNRAMERKSDAAQLQLNYNRKNRFKNEKFQRGITRGTKWTRTFVQFFFAVRKWNAIFFAASAFVR